MSALEFYGAASFLGMIATSKLTCPAKWFFAGGWLAAVVVGAVS